MSQISTKFLGDGSVLSGAIASHGKIGSGAATSNEALFSDGSGGTGFRTILASDVPTLNQNTTGTAANITATSNSTLTTLSALTTASSLAISGSQVSGGTLGVTNGSNLTNLSAAALSGVLPVGVTGGSGLSIATSQLTGNISLTTQVSGTLPTSNGGTGQTSAAAAYNALTPMTTTGDLVYESATNVASRLPIGSTGQVLTVVGGVPTWATTGAAALTTNHIFVGSAGGVATDVAMSGEATIVASGAVTLSNAAVIAKVLTGYTSGAGTITSADSILSAIEKLNGNDANYLPLAGGTMSGAIHMGSNAIDGLSAGTSTGQPLTWDQLGAISGVASLDGSGKVPLSQLPATLMEFKGSWNPNTNTPTLVDGTGTTGFTYWVSALDTGTVSGLTDPSMTNFQIGDLVIYNGTKWVLVTPAAGVESVNGSQGAVTVNAISQLTGDATAGPASGSQSQVLTLATVNSNTGSFGGASSVPSFTVNAKGLITAASSTAVVAPAGTLSGTTLNSTVVTSSLTSVGTLTSGALGTGFTAVAIAQGGTGQTTAAAAFNALAPSTATGGLIVGTGSNTYGNLAIGSTGNVLTVSGGTAVWAAPAATATNNKETFVLSSTDITNQYVTLAHTPLANSVSFLVVGGGDQLEGSSYDFVVSGTQIQFKNGLASGGVSALTSGDILQIQYEF